MRRTSVVPGEAEGRDPESMNTFACDRRRCSWVPAFAGTTAEFSHQTIHDRSVARVRACEVDAVTFTSSSTVTNFCDVVGPLTAPQPSVISIGPVTSQSARDLGLRVDAEADPHTIDGLLEALVRRLGQ